MYQFSIVGILVIILSISTMYQIFTLPNYIYAKIPVRTSCSSELSTMIVNDSMRTDFATCKQMYNLSMKDTLQRVCSSSSNLGNPSSFHGAGPSKIIRYVTEQMVGTGGFSSGVVPFQYSTCHNKSLYCVFTNPCPYVTDSNFERLDFISSIGHVSNLYKWFIFNTSPHINEQLSTYTTTSLNMSSEYIVMHIRRGDSCNDRGRKCYNLSSYINAAREFRIKYNINKIFVVTDSDLVIQQIHKYTEFTWYYNQINRSSFGGDESKQITLIENRKNRNNDAILCSMIADLRIASYGSYLIGTSRSFFTTSIATLLFATHKTTIPVISIEGSVLSHMFYYRYLSGRKGKWKASWYDRRAWIESLS